MPDNESLRAQLAVTMWAAGTADERRKTTPVGLLGKADDVLLASYARGHLLEGREFVIVTPDSEGAERLRIWLDTLPADLRPLFP